jgi:histidinol phosphatase-like PHP family hydrolase
MGLSAIVFTDHFVEDPAAPGAVSFYATCGPAMIADLRAELARIEPPEGCHVYLGCETETMSTGWVGVSPATSAALDFVLVPTTHYHLPGVPRPASWAPGHVADHMLTMLEAVVTRPWLDSVAHPFAESEALIGDLRGIYDAMDRARLEDVLGLAARHGVALEVNASSLEAENMPHYAGVYAEIVRLAHGLGVRFTCGSDAHDHRDLGITPAAEAWIAAVGLTPDDFLTPEALRARRG